MNAENAERAMTELRECWQYQPIPNSQVRHWQNVFSHHTPETVRAVLDQFGANAMRRPEPGEFGERCNAYIGKREGRVQHPGPFLADVQPPPPDLSSRIQGLRELVKR